MNVWLIVSSITIITVNVAIIFWECINKEKTEALSVLGIGNVRKIS